MSDEKTMGQVIQIDEARIRDHLGEMVRGTVEETLNAMLDAEPDQLCGAGRYERSQARQDTRAGSYERTVHFYRNVFSHVPATKVRDVSHMLKAIHAQESREAAGQKAKAIIEDLRAGKMTKAADLVEQAVHETLTYYAFPDIHWQKIRTNNPLERIMREIRRRTRVVGAFPDGQSCLNLAAARLRYIAGTAWSTKRYMNMRPLYLQQLSETGAVA